MLEKRCGELGRVNGYFQGNLRKGGVCLAQGWVFAH